MHGDQGGAVGAQAHEGGVADGELSGIADDQVQAGGHDCVDANKNE